MQVSPREAVVVDDVDILELWRPQMFQVCDKRSVEGRQEGPTTVFGPLIREEGRAMDSHRGFAGSGSTEDDDMTLGSKGEDFSLLPFRSWQCHIAYCLRRTAEAHLPWWRPEPLRLLKQAAKDKGH